jgi:hypothetical protein
MPGLARPDAPGMLHHIMIRGIESRKMFRDAEDRENFLERLGGLLPGMSPAGGYAVQGGELMGRERGYQLTP